MTMVYVCKTLRDRGTSEHSSMVKWHAGSGISWLCTQSLASTGPTYAGDLFAGKDLLVVDDGTDIVVARHCGVVKVADNPFHLHGSHDNCQCVPAEALYMCALLTFMRLRMQDPLKISHSGQRRNPYDRARMALRGLSWHNDPRPVRGVHSARLKGEECAEMLCSRTWQTLRGVCRGADLQGCGGVNRVDLGVRPDALDQRSVQGGGRQRHIICVQGLTRHLH